MTNTSDDFFPPAAAGLPAGTLEAAEIGANRLDAWARTSHGRNFLAHALVQLARTGWLRTEPGDGFEPMRDPEPAAPAAVEPPADQTTPSHRAALSDRIADAVQPLLMDTLPKAIAAAQAREITAAVLAVLPAPADRATVLRDAADAIDNSERLRDFTGDHMSDINEAANELRRMADETATTQTDTLPAWLYQRFMPDGTGWDNLDEDDRQYWEHQARAVRQAVARGGFKQPAAGARQDGGQP